MHDPLRPSCVRQFVLADHPFVFVQREISDRFSVTNLLQGATPTSKPHQLSNANLLNLPDQCFAGF